MGGDSQTCNGDGNTSNPLNNPDAKCQPAQCGDGYVNIAFKPQGSMKIEICDTLGGDSQTCNGNGTGKDDDPNNADAKCQPAQCGDGYVNMAFKPPGSKRTETCDTLGGDSQTCNGDGNISNPLNNPDAKCQPAQCGDGYVNIAFKPQGSTKIEICDTLGGDSQTCNGDGNKDLRNNANAQCQMPKCGDGYVNSQFIVPGTTHTEECDIGDPSNGIQAVKCSGTKNCSTTCACI